MFTKSQLLKRRESPNVLLCMITKKLNIPADETCNEFARKQTNSPFIIDNLQIRPVKYQRRSNITTR